MSLLLRTALIGFALAWAYQEHTSGMVLAVLVWLWVRVEIETRLRMVAAKDAEAREARIAEFMESSIATHESMLEVVKALGETTKQQPMVYDVSQLDKLN